MQDGFNASPLLWRGCTGEANDVGGLRCSSVYRMTSVRVSTQKQRFLKGRRFGLSFGRDTVTGSGFMELY